MQQQPGNSTKISQIILLPFGIQRAFSRPNFRLVGSHYNKRNFSRFLAVDWQTNSVHYSWVLSKWYQTNNKLSSDVVE